MANSDGGSDPRALYGVTMQEAIASGDLNRLNEIRDQALDHIANVEDVRRLLPDLDNAISASGGTVRPLYAVTIQDALCRGDEAELARLRAEVNLYADLVYSDCHDHCDGPIPLYAAAIQEAKERGDEAEVRRLTARAQTLLQQLNGS